MQYVLAVDGGNTKTIALVAALDGTILGSGRAGCGDIYGMDGERQIGSSMALSNIEAAVTQALQAAGVERSALVSSVFSLAGADWPEDFALLEAAMNKRGFGQTILVQNDALGVLHTGSSENVGVAVVCGTGTATGARGPDGRVWHSSFWQTAGAEGSYDLANKALKAVFRSELGLAEPTTLKQRVLDFYLLPTIDEVLHRITSLEHRQHRLRRIEGLTPLLLDEAAAGDGLALHIVQEHGRELGNIAIVAARKVGIEGTTFSLVLSGGVLRHPSSILPDAIIERVHTTSPEAQPTRSRFEPAIGALFTALERAGSMVTSTLLERIISTLPDAVFFETASGHYSSPSGSDNR